MVLPRWRHGGNPFAHIPHQQPVDSVYTDQSGLSAFCARWSVKMELLPREVIA
jgi:hypothetical protein